MNKTVLINEQIDSFCSRRAHESRGLNSAELEHMKEMLKSAMGCALTEKQRRCVELYWFDRRTLTQTGKALGIAPSTVSRHLKAAKKKLQKLRGLI